MSQRLTNLEALSTRAGFNAAVRHIQKAIDISGEAGSNNLGDILYEMGDESLSGERAGLLLRMLLVDKLGYRTASANLASAAPRPAELAGEFARWKGVDLVAAYHHPELGLLVANPKNAGELAGFGGLRKRELMVVYAGRQGSPADEDCGRAAELALRLFEGRAVKAPPALLRGSFAVRAVSKPDSAKPAAPKKAAPRAAKTRPAAPAVSKTAAAPMRMTPRYAVVVQNELFHNGNVEAWKRIVASYKAAHPTLEVYIYYEGERILDINSLFKWGKVKHGSAIEFAVAGDNIQNVAKLQRYLAQGASNQFEAFLRGPVNSIMRLF